MDDSKGEIEAERAIGISVEMQYAGGRKAVFQTHVPQTVSPETLNRLLDVWNAVADRAEAFYAQEQARRQLEVEEKAVLNMVRRLGEVEENMQLKASDPSRRIVKLSERDLVEKKQVFDTLEEGKRRVAECKAHLADLIKRAGNRDGASSPANL